MAIDHHHMHGRDPAAIPNDARYREIRKVTLIGSAVDLLLGLAKVLFGFLFNSQALIADGVHSFSDLGTDFMVLWAAKHAHREADDEHPYGHGRIETVATVGLGVSLIAVAVGIVWDAIHRLFNPELLLSPGAGALAIAFVSVLSKEGLYHYSMHLARKMRSNMLKANAWHSRTDAISSIVVMIGVGGTMAGLPYLDAIAAVGVAAMIAKIGWDLAWHSVRELIDTALDEERVALIRREIVNVDGVRSLHMLRTRRMGQDALVDVHILVDPKLSVSEGHHISERVRRHLIERIDEVQDVLVHIDPEDDELAPPSSHLPAREEVMAQLGSRWSDIDEAEQIRKVTLHYLQGQLTVDVVLPLDVVIDHDQAEALARRLAAPAEELEDIRRIDVYYHQG